VGCAHQRGDAGPDARVRELGRALEEASFESAYAMLAHDPQGKRSLDDFRKRINDNPRETQALVESLRHVVATRVWAEVELADGTRITLERASSAQPWRVVSPIADFYPQHTPRSALHSFVRAVRRDRADVLLSLMPNAARGDLSAEQLKQNLEPQREELERLVALLETSLTAPIEIVGDRAAMPYGESYTARFVREDGLWKIEDPE
jgi:hypothetical protein